MPASPPDPGTSVQVSATIQILGHPIAVNTGDITKGFNFQLTQPVVLGTIDQFIDWLDTNLHTGVTSDEVNALQGYIPIPALKSAYISFLTAQVSITTLIINTKAGNYAFGATMTFTNPISVLGLLEFDSIGVLISKAGAGSP
jgi:hypothetical protein